MGFSDLEQASGQHATHDFLISRSSLDDRYDVWKFDPEAPELLTLATVGEQARFDNTRSLAPVGGYMLDWSPLPAGGRTRGYPYRLFRFNPDNADPLAASPVQKGVWPATKFWSPGQAQSEGLQAGQPLQLIPMASFMLSFLPEEEQGAFQLWNFDPRPTRAGGADPLPTPCSPQGAFPTIQAGHKLIPMGNYVLDWTPATGDYRVWSFDPQLAVPLDELATHSGHWRSIDARHRLVPIGEWLLDWVPADRTYRLWHFNPDHADPLTGPVGQGRMPNAFSPYTTLASVQPTIPVQDVYRDTPGTIDYMRTRIKHVVYYMLQSRSFDNVCGWLYEQGEEGVQYVGTDEPFHGVSTDFYNRDGDRDVHLRKFRDGELSEDWDLAVLGRDPVRRQAEAVQQMFDEASPGYEGRARPDMGGFVRHTANDRVMETFSPEQLPVFNGLARHFGVSDEWFSSVPGATDVNRAGSLTGSALNRQSGPSGGPERQRRFGSRHRQSIWKVLWSNGFTDWKIYNAAVQVESVPALHPYLEGQIPTVDANSAGYLVGMDQFKVDASAGTLPAFSYLEPVWIGPDGVTSYGPGASLVPGEVALNEIYEALRAGPGWDDTLLIVTFDKNGGLYDHVPPPYAKKAWPGDAGDGFNYDLMGPRVPTVAVSPWIMEQTVFRADGDVPFDATSFPATLLSWFGIPKARWGLGDRTHEAPTFESVFLSTWPREDAPELTPPFDKSHPAKSRR